LSLPSLLPRSRALRPLHSFPTRRSSDLSSCERNAVTSVPAEIDSLAAPIQPVIQAEGDQTRRRDTDIHAVPVRHLVDFVFWFQRLKRSVRQHLRAASEKYRRAVLGGS